MYDQDGFLNDSYKSLFETLAGARCYPYEEDCGGAEFLGYKSIVGSRDDVMYEEFKGIGRYWNLLARKLGRAKPPGITCSFLIFLSLLPSSLQPISAKPPFYIYSPFSLRSLLLVFFSRHATLLVGPNPSVSSSVVRCLYTGCRRARIY